MLTLTFTEASAVVSSYGEHCFKHWHALIKCLASSTGWWCCSRCSSTVCNRRAIHRCTGKLGCEEGKHPRFALFMYPFIHPLIQPSIHSPFSSSIYPLSILQSIYLWKNFILMSMSRHSTNYKVLYNYMSTTSQSSNILFWWSSNWHPPFLSSYYSSIRPSSSILSPFHSSIFSPFHSSIIPFSHPFTI